MDIDNIICRTKEHQGEYNDDGEDDNYLETTYTCGFIRSNQ